MIEWRSVWFLPLTLELTAAQLPIPTGFPPLPLLVFPGTSLIPTLLDEWLHFYSHLTWCQQHFHLQTVPHVQNAFPVSFYAVTHFWFSSPLWSWSVPSFSPQPSNLASSPRPTLTQQGLTSPALGPTKFIFSPHLYSDLLTPVTDSWKLSTLSLLNVSDSSSALWPPVHSPYRLLYLLPLWCAIHSVLCGGSSVPGLAAASPTRPPSACLQVSAADSPSKM